MVQLAQKPHSNLAFTWEDLLTLLRDELQEYGGLVGLLSAQQQSILDRRTESGTFPSCHTTHVSKYY